MLIVDEFGVENVGEEHVLHLLSVLKWHYEVSEDWKGKKYKGIDLEHKAYLLNYPCLSIVHV